MTSIYPDSGPSNTAELATLVLTPIKTAVSCLGATMEVLVRVQAPSEQPSQSTGDKAPQATAKRLALVVDRSGSMNGEPLKEALACVQFIAERLTKDDSLALVVYDDAIETLVPLRAGISASEIAQIIDGVESGGSTNLFGGWQEGADQLEGGNANAISRVILLSDGQANSGLQNIEMIEGHCRKWLAKGVSTTTVGLGRGFNENLMSAMAVAGGGQQYYGQTAADLFDSFDEEFSLLQALTLRQLDVRFVPASGVIIEPVGLVHTNADSSVRLNDLAFGSEAWVLLRLHISPGAVGTLRDCMAVTLNAKDMDGQAITPIMKILTLPVLDDASYQALPKDDTVVRRTLELEFARDSQKLRQIAKSGDANEMKRFMDELQNRFGHHPWLADKLDRLRALAAVDLEMLSKEVMFSSAKMSRRLESVHEVLYCMDQTEEAMPSFLRKKAEEGRGRPSDPDNILKNKNTTKKSTT